MPGLLATLQVPFIIPTHEEWKLAFASDVFRPLTHKCIPLVRVTVVRVSPVLAYAGPLSPLLSVTVKVPSEAALSVRSAHVTQPEPLLHGSSRVLPLPMLRVFLHHCCSVRLVWLCWLE